MSRRWDPWCPGAPLTPERPCNSTEPTCLLFLVPGTWEQCPRAAGHLKPLWTCGCSWCWSLCCRLAFCEQKWEETGDERKRRCWENDKGNFKDMQRSWKNGYRSRWEELKENLLRKEGRKWIREGKNRGKTLYECKEIRLWLKFEERLKENNSWLENESWVSTITEYGWGSYNVHVWSGFQLETFLNFWFFWLAVESQSRIFVQVPGCCWLKSRPILIIR